MNVAPSVLSYLIFVTENKLASPGTEVARTAANETHNWRECATFEKQCRNSPNNILPGMIA